MSSACAVCLEAAPDAAPCAVCALRLCEDCKDRMVHAIAFPSSEEGDDDGVRARLEQAVHTHGCCVS